MNTEDLLSFKEYSPIHETHATSGHAEININSPTRQNTYGQTGQSASDPLQDFISSIGATVNVLHDEDRNMQINNNGKTNEI